MHFFRLIQIIKIGYLLLNYLIFLTIMITLILIYQIVHFILKYFFQVINFKTDHHLFIFLNPLILFRVNFYYFPRKESSFLIPLNMNFIYLFLIQEPIFWQFLILTFFLNYQFLVCHQIANLFC